MQQGETFLSKKKTGGRIYTPDYIVQNILDLCGYRGEGILGKHIIDNSCGDGAFLVEIVRRYCETGFNAGLSALRIGSDLSEYIHGIEIDACECEKARENVSNIAADFGINGVAWDIRAADTLTVKAYHGKMDYVVGNPPYVRVHNLQKSYDAVKEYSFAQNGMTDLYIVFYEIGLHMLNPSGVLGYISPSSLYNSVAGSAMRKHLTNHRSIKAVVDLKHFQPFEATTYTTILVLTAEENDYADYYEYDGKKRLPLAVSRLEYEDFIMNDFFVFGQKDTLAEMQKMMLYRDGAGVCVVKNGFATLCDEFFIGEFPFTDYTIPIVKASTGQISRCLFPYDEAGRIIPYDVLTENPQIRKHYENYEDKLRGRSLEKEHLWYGFGRTQGINDVRKKKYAINALIRGVPDIKLQLCEPGTGVYSGLYILAELGEEELKSLLFSDDFIRYVAMLGKYKSGGYYTYSSKDLSRYLNYKFAERNGYPYEQLTIP